MPYMIGIAGESGVGKSTIAEIVSLFFGTHDTTIISTDDLHKWDRFSPMWKQFTHLNPDANNLELGDLHIQDLSQGRFIYRSIYSHRTGYFEPPIKIEPKNIVIVEGLHSFYTDVSKALIELKIFVDTDEDLRVHWKIIRDTEERGYTYNTALEAINKRRADSIKMRSQQIDVADVVIRLTTDKPISRIGDRNEKINLVTQIKFKDESHRALMKFVETYITEFNKFVFMSETVGQNLNMCQNGGGNVSTKILDEYMIIKSSGYNLKDVYRLNGYSLVSQKKFDNVSEPEFDATVVNSVISDKYKRPSMETGFHCLLNKYVIHVHPIYLTLLLCLEDSKHIIDKLFMAFDYNYITYAHPGFDLYDAVRNSDISKPVFFLENHGVIISCKDQLEAIDLLNQIDSIAKRYIDDVSVQWGDFNLEFDDKTFQSGDRYVFPDAVIFLHDDTKKEIRAAHNYILLVGNELGYLRYLSVDDVHHLSNLESEKYRKSL